MTSLRRFEDAQDGVFEAALGELKTGAKRSHWMWFIFPQVSGLGHSKTARYYAISGLEEARAYLRHPLLGARLAQCTEALLEWAGKRSALDIFGPVDALKLASSMTLFEAAGGGASYAAVLDAYYAGQRDQRTLALLGLDG